MESTDPYHNETILVEIMRRHSTSLMAQPTGVELRLKRLAGIRAVVFDVYGTLVISGSGDVGTTDVDSRPIAFTEALQASGYDYDGNPVDGVAMIRETIATHHERERSNGTESPEVVIQEVWIDVLRRLRAEGQLRGVDEINDETLTIDPLAVEYEVRTNPTWEMPGAGETLATLKEMGLTLGIVSNAQSFTRLLFDVHFGASLSELGFVEPLCVWSFHDRQAKPGTFLYEQSAERLRQQGIDPHQVLYVGNDMLKDVWPASQVGFQTALFAGDARSYRPREDDPRVADVTPTLILTKLSQLLACVNHAPTP